MELRHVLLLVVMASAAARADEGDERPSCARRAPRDVDATAESCLGCHATGRRAPRRFAAADAVAVSAAAKPERRACGLVDVEPEAPSRSCLECHGPGVGGAPRIRGHASHPYDVPYRGGGSGQGMLNGEHHVRARLRLPGGLVTCTTCHDGQSRLPFRVARPLNGEPWRERLCNVCHVLDGDGEDRGWMARNGR